jgi:hypothetical protein
MSERVEIRRNPDGSVDEVIARMENGFVHIEQLSENQWWVGLQLNKEEWRIVWSTRRSAPIDIFVENETDPDEWDKLEEREEQ